MSEALGYFFMSWVDPKLLFLIASGTFCGIYIGAIPGLSVTMAVSILISFTFKWDMNSALAVIAGIYLGGVYGGSRSSILLNIPGAPSAIATGLDGYPLAKRGEAGKAIGLTTIMSVYGGFVGILVLAVAAPAVASLALKFAPRDYLMLAIWGILLVGSLSGGSLAKGIFAGAFGVIIGSVGLDPMTAEPRFTFGNLQLTAGISYVAAMIGFFGVAEVLVQLHEMHLKAVKQNVAKIIPPWSLVRKYLPLATRTSGIGVVVGALPGAGGDIAALMAYDHAKRSVKHPSAPFGEGAYEGLVAPESSNNAAVPGAYIPMLTLGIPGDAVTAVIIGAMYIHGLKPGPMLMIETPHLFWFQVGALVLANIFLLIFGMTGIKLFARIVETPKPILLPLILLLSAVGAYAINNNPSDVYWMLGFGVVGYFFKMYGFQVGPIILGMILGPLMDKSYRQAMISSEGNITQFAGEFFTSPLSAIILAALTLTILSQTSWWKRMRGIAKV
ncbi:MAG: tripartite tricarboxylate transporter permease [Rhodoferax sp.]|jgi:putative tricarboxylic transport membrane protein|uniref:tripartite tricarboxylate transporter permease n=1 Tax=Rhodoferax sp. TaxID=50421 RepID=UPI001B5DD191|nr:tripartite tricarboxylate transporter permease [Rhodoferax sp.]MBP9150107.1 tripartite tricarboxylate transporter permease [Rhodoferax sp.]MBP9735148.1 tripartite tricarboxylate transporter permease [Rhodoferax sp.]